MGSTKFSYAAVAIAPPACCTGRTVTSCQPYFSAASLVVTKARFKCSQHWIAKKTPCASVTLINAANIASATFMEPAVPILSPITSLVLQPTTKTCPALTAPIFNSSCAAAVTCAAISAVCITASPPGQLFCQHDVHDVHLQIHPAARYLLSFLPVPRQ